MVTRNEAMAVAESFVAAHRHELARAAIVGSVLRDHPWCKDADVLVVWKAGVAADKQNFRDPPLNVFVTTRECWEAALLQYAPGMVTIGIRAKAKKCGYRLNQYGLWRDEALVSQRAAEICRLVGAPLPEPVRRSLAGELVLVGAAELRRKGQVTHGNAVGVEG